MAIASKASMEFRFPDQGSCGAAMEALRHEARAGTRSKTELEADGPLLRIRIEAEDPVALRASMNAYLRAISAFGELEGAHQ